MKFTITKVYAHNYTHNFMCTHPGHNLQKFDEKESCIIFLCHKYFSLVPRPLPAFQCCTEHAGYKKFNDLYKVIVTFIPALPIHDTGLSAGAVAGVATASVVIFVLAAVVFGLCIGLLIYGYRNPQSKVGLYMIEVRSVGGNHARFSGKINVTRTFCHLSK